MASSNESSPRRVFDLVSSDSEAEYEYVAVTAGEEDEDTGAQIAPIVNLEEVAVTTGEEHEENVLELVSKLYRFNKEGNQWNERGTGSVKLLRHNVTDKVRLLFRQSMTLKIRANHLVIRSTKVLEHAHNNKACVWHAADFSDGELKDELFCIRFGSVENCNKFVETMQEITEYQENEESDDASSTAGLVGEDAFSTSGLLEKLDEDAYSTAGLLEKLSGSQLQKEESKDAYSTAGLLEKLSRSQLEKEESKDASSTVGLLEKLSVDDKDTKEEVKDSSDAPKTKEPEKASDSENKEEEIK